MKTDIKTIKQTNENRKTIKTLNKAIQKKTNIKAIKNH